MQGRTVDLVPKGLVWIARRDSPQLTLREQNGEWVMYDGRGLTYVFATQSSLLRGQLVAIELCDWPRWRHLTTWL